MVELHELTPVGFGGYRLALTKEHYGALARAISIGCNLIDTSPNYTNGRSEELIGRVTTDLSSYDVFVTTKVGYITGSAASEIPGHDEIQREVVWLGDDTGHCIHPDFIRTQVERSRCRLQRSCLDGVLLHNPEYYFQSSNAERTEEQFYRRIKCAFECLEEYVSQGKIRYYGVSSNTLPLSTDLESTTNVNELLHAACQVAENHHFRIIQFPFNLLERGALMAHHDGARLIDVARRNKLITIGNRPLNALSEGKALRLATYDRQSIGLEGTLKECLDALSEQLERASTLDDQDDHDLIASLYKYCSDLENTDAVDFLLRNYLYSFLVKRFCEHIPGDVMSIFNKLYDCVDRLTRRTITDRVNQMRQEFVRAGLIAASDDRPFAVVACDSYLRSGVDHVLVGMKRTEYVDQLISFFH